MKPGYYVNSKLPYLNKYFIGLRLYRVREVLLLTLFSIHNGQKHHIGV